MRTYTHAARKEHKQNASQLTEARIGIRQSEAVLQLDEGALRNEDVQATIRTHCPWIDTTYCIAKTIEVHATVHIETSFQHAHALKHDVEQGNCWKHQPRNTWATAQHPSGTHRPVNKEAFEQTAIDFSITLLMERPFSAVTDPNAE